MLTSGKARSQGKAEGMDEQFFICASFLTIPDSKPSQKPYFASREQKRENAISSRIHIAFRRLLRKLAKLILGFKSSLSHRYLLINQAILKTFAQSFHKKSPELLTVARDFQSPSEAERVRL
jgi:hypothetical protein